MHTSFALVFLTILSYTVFAGDYPLVGVVLLQSAPRSEAFGTVTLTQQAEGGSIIVDGKKFLILNQTVVLVYMFMNKVILQMDVKVLVHILIHIQNYMVVIEV